MNPRRYTVLISLAAPGHTEQACGEHNIVSDIEVIDIKDINAAYERVIKSDVRYRFVIDMATLKA